MKRILLVFLLLVLISGKAHSVTKTELFEKVFGKNISNQQQVVDVLVYIDGVRAKRTLPILYNSITTEYSLTGGDWYPFFEQSLKPEKLATLKRLFENNLKVTRDDLIFLGFTSRFSLADLTLTIESPYDFRKKVVLLVRGEDNLFNWDDANIDATPAKLSGYMNYSLSQIYSQNYPFTSFSNAGAINYEENVVQMESNYDSEDHGFHLSGLRYYRDDSERQLRYIVGSVSPILFSAPSIVNSIVGVGLRRSWGDFPSYDFRIPYKKEFVLKEPGTVSILLNGDLIFQRNVPAGQFELKGFPFSSGVNEIRTYFKGNGATENLGTDFIFQDDRFLSRSQYEFGLYAGLPTAYGESRNIFNLDSNAPALMAHFRFGLYDDFTLNSVGQFQTGFSLLGTGFQSGSSFGVYDVAFLRSQNQALEGYALRGSISGFTHKNMPFSWDQTYFLNASLFSDKYTPSRLSAPSTGTLQVSPGVFWNLGFGKSLNFSIDYYHYTNNSDFLGYSLTTAYQPSSTLSFVASLSQQASLTQQNGILFQLFCTISDLDSGSRYDARYTSRPELAISASSVPKGTTNTFTSSYWDATYSGQDSYQVGLSTRYYSSLAALRYFKQGDTSSTRFSVSTYGQRGIINTNLDYASAGNFGLNYTLQSAFVFAEDQFTFSSPVNGSFVIIAPSKSLQRHRLDFTGDASIDEWGPGVSPQLISHSIIPISLNKTDGAIGVDMGRSSYHIKTGSSSGTVLRVGGEGTLMVFGSLKDSDGKPFDLAYFKLVSISHPKEVSRTFFTNSKGQFSAMGISVGTYEIQFLNFNNKPVRFEVKAGSVSPVRLDPIVVK